MRTRRRRRLAALMALVAMGAPACSGGTKGPATPTSPRGQSSSSPVSPSPSIDAVGTVSGTWDGQWQTDRTPEAIGSFHVTFVQDGTKLSGPIQITGTPCITTGTITGTVDGNAIRFGAVHGQQTITYTGTVVHSVMSGTYSAPSCGNSSGSWTAIKSTA
jgi:hypothetical protein